MDQTRRSSRTSMRSKQLGQLLAENGDVSSEQVQQALKAQEEQGGMLGAILQRMGACGADAVGHALAKQVQVTDIQCEDIGAVEDTARLVPYDFCLKEKLCPFERLGGLLCVVMSNPLNRKAILDVESMTRMHVKAFKAPWAKVHELIEREYAGPGPGIAKPPARQAAPLEELSFELEEPGPPPVRSASHEKTASAQPVSKPAPAAEKEPLPLDDIIIPPTAPDDMPAGPTGILEIPMDSIAVPTYNTPAPPTPRMVQPPQHGEIKGLDTLGSRDAELVDIARRRPLGAAKAPPKKAAPKVAQVNVDLEHFDQSADAEMIETVEHPASEAMDEIEHGAFEPGASRVSAGVLVAMKIVPDTYFYAGTAPKNAPRSDDLLDIIEALPVAEIIAESIADFERMKMGGKVSITESGKFSLTGTASAGKSRVDLQRAPATPMAAIRLGEGEFQKLTLMMVEDELGEWEWNVASTGPIAVEAFEE